MTEYFLPSWWNWIETDWSRCQACLEYNHTPCTSCEIPPGILAMVCLVGGGTATIAGNMRGNVSIYDEKQARAASRISSRKEVNAQLNKQQARNLQRYNERI